MKNFSSEQSSTSALQLRAAFKQIKVIRQACSLCNYLAERQTRWTLQWLQSPFFRSAKQSTHYPPAYHVHHGQESLTMPNNRLRSCLLANRLGPMRFIEYEVHSMSFMLYELLATWRNATARPLSHLTQVQLYSCITTIRVAMPLFPNLSIPKKLWDWNCSRTHFVANFLNYS